jgi:hypothetical protein
MEICNQACTGCNYNQGHLCRQYAYLDEEHRTMKKMLLEKISSDGNIKVEDIIQENLDLRHKVEWLENKLHQKNIKNAQYVPRCSKCNYKEQQELEL